MSRHADTKPVDVDGVEQEAPTRDELWEAASVLATRDDVLRQVGADATEAGFAGPTTGLRLTYLAATTRLLKRPVSVAFRGQSSAGKSFTIKHVLAFLPTEAFVVLTAMSEKALVYMDVDLRHKMLVVQEGAGLSGDFQAYAVRSLLSEGRLEYAYTDFEHKRVVWIEKEGPTGLLTSTAGRIDGELTTRLVTPNVEDTPDLTREILRAEGKNAQGLTATVEYGPHRDLQRAIAAGPCDVIVPFAGQLAEAVDDKAVRMRRDFPAVLGLVQAHALLHQQGRETDAANRVVATVADYAVVYELVAEMVAESAGEAVPASVRETVEAVDDLEATVTAPGPRAATIAKVAARLGVGRTSASRRLARAAALGYVVDVSMGRNVPKLFETRERMPQDRGVLPSPETLG